MKSALSLLALAATLLINPASAGSIQSLAGLQGVRVYEATSLLAHQADFSLGDARLTTRIIGAALTQAGRDFGFYNGNENYDLFFSDADGTLNTNGSFVSIEGNCDVPYSCFNITEIALVKTGGVLEYANSVASVVYGGGPQTAGSHLKAIDGNLTTYTQLGDTIGMPVNARMRLTVGFASVTAVPEPETYAMLLAGLGLVGFAVRRRATSFWLFNRYLLNPTRNFRFPFKNMWLQLTANNNFHNKFNGLHETNS